MKLGVVDVGGGLRGIYAAGVFDRCLDAGIRFDEGAMVASDVSFNLEVAARLSRLCILPGLTGCVYHVRGDSLYQSADDDKRDIGVMDMYDRLADISDAYGFDISEFLWSLMYRSCKLSFLVWPDGGCRYMNRQGPR